MMDTLLNNLDVVLWPLIVLLTLLASSFYSGSETGMYCLNKVRLRLKMEGREPAALALGRTLDDPQRFVTGMLIGMNISGFLLTASVTLLLTRSLHLSDEQAEFYITLIMTPVVFVLCEVVPKALFQRDADVLMYRLAYLLRASDLLMRSTGLVRLLSSFSTYLIQRVTPADEYARERLASPRSRAVDLLREGMLSHVVHPEHSAMVDRVLNLSATPVHLAMVPRNRIVGIPTGMDRASLLAAIKRSNHSRLPVYRGSMAHVIGILHVHEALADPTWNRVEERMEACPQIEAHQTVASAIVALQKSGQPMAIVVDRAGRALGLATLKDLLEEIVGDLPAW